MTKESPCAKGKVISFSLYCGKSVPGKPLDFAPGGSPPGAPHRNMLWIDTLRDDEVRLQRVARHLLSRGFSVSEAAT